MEHRHWPAGLVPAGPWAAFTPAARIPRVRPSLGFLFCFGAKRTRTLPSGEHRHRGDQGEAWRGRSVGAVPCRGGAGVPCGTAGGDTRWLPHCRHLGAKKTGSQLAAGRDTGMSLSPSVPGDCPCPAILLEVLPSLRLLVNSRMIWKLDTKDSHCEAGPETKL